MSESRNSAVGTVTAPDATANITPAVEVKHVSMSFNMASEQLNSLKEYFIKLVRHELFFKEFVALDDISFTVEPGDVYGIVGTNGSGKSTMLKVIAGVLDPTKGTCTVHGTIAPLIELGAGFDLELTARENIYLNGALLGYSRSYISEHFDEIVEFAELEDFLDLPMKNYSSGMVARIAFAIATIMVPDILIVDETLAVGDVFFQEKCERRINSLINEYNTTVLFVSHSIGQVERICKRALWIEKGQKLMEGDVEEVCRAYRNMEYIDYMGNHGIMTHENQDSFKPNDELTYGELREAFADCMKDLADTARLFDGVVASDSSLEDSSPEAAWGETDTGVAHGAAYGVLAGHEQTIASREDTADLIYKFACLRRPELQQFNPKGLGAFADAGTINPAKLLAMTWCTQFGLIDGTRAKDGSNLLEPQAPITRIVFAKMLTKMFRERLAYPDDISPTEPFVRAGIYDYVRQYDLMHGYASGRFDPHGPVTRGQAITVLWRAAGEPSAKSNTTFTDVPREEYTFAPISWAQSEELLPTSDDGLFHPDDVMTREDFRDALDVFTERYVLQSLRSLVDEELRTDFVEDEKPSTQSASGKDLRVSNAVSRAILAHVAMAVREATRM